MSYVNIPIIHMVKISFNIAMYIAEKENNYKQKIYTSSWQTDTVCQILHIC